MQFSQIDIFDKNNKYHKKTDKYSRNWSIFNKREFEEEINQVNWDEVSSPTNGTDQSFKIVYQKIKITR